jgi:hypothetical protein
VTGKAYLTLLNIGFSPGPIALKILHPAIAAASLEEDEALQTIWANLLANAADPREVNRVPPSFTTVLKDLTSWDVKFLDALVRQAETRVSEDGLPNGPLEIVEFYPPDLQSAADAAKRGYDVEELLTDKRKRDEEARTIGLSMDTLNRLGLIHRNYSAQQSSDYPTGLVVSHTLSLTTLCLEFVRACRQPKESKAAKT